MADTDLSDREITTSEVNKWKERSKRKNPQTTLLVQPIHKLWRNELISSWAETEKEITGIPTHRWLAFNKAFGGIRSGEVTVITGETGFGKTTFAFNWAVDCALYSDTSFFLISLELPWKKTALKLARILHGKPITPETSPEDLLAVRELFHKLGSWYFVPTGSIKTVQLMDAIAYAAIEKKTRFVVIDHLGYLVREGREETNALAIENTMKELSMLATQLEIAILLIVHPGKLYTRDYKSRPVDLDDLKGSSSIKQEASNVLSIYRPSKVDPLTDVNFFKIRSDDYGSSLGGKIQFEFDPVSLHLREISKTIEFPGE